jgi:hypothetical protein
VFRLDGVPLPKSLRTARYRLALHQFGAFLNERRLPVVGH